jgi:hypothetical protein
MNIQDSESLEWGWLRILGSGCEPDLRVLAGRYLAEIVRRVDAEGQAG